MENRLSNDYNAVASSFQMICTATKARFPRFEFSCGNRKLLRFTRSESSEVIDTSIHITMEFVEKTESCALPSVLLVRLIYRLMCNA